MRHVEIQKTTRRIPCWESVSGGFSREIFSIIGLRAFIFAARRFRRPPVSAPPLGGLRRALPVLFSCLRASNERPIGLSRTLFLCLLSTHWPHSPWGWANARGPDLILYRSGQRIMRANRRSIREEDCKRSTGSQTGGKTPHCSAFQISAGQVLVLSTTRLPHRSSLSALQPIASCVLASRLCPARRTTEVWSRRETRNRSSHISCGFLLAASSRRRLALRSQRQPQEYTRSSHWTVPVSFPASLQSLFALLMQVPELPSAPSVWDTWWTGRNVVSVISL